MKLKLGKAFTLVELIVVITILIILGTISFISFQGYSKEARDSKRITDTKNLLSKINFEMTKGENIDNFFSGIRDEDIIIDGKPAKSKIGTVNFEYFRENAKFFRDPLNNYDYPIAYSFGGVGTGSYKFIQIATISEKENVTRIFGNYYKFLYSDLPSLFKKDGIFYEDKKLPLIYNAGIIIPTINSCKNKPDYENVEFFEGNPSFVDQDWQNSNSNLACYFRCISGYIFNSGTKECELKYNLPEGVDIEESTIGCGYENPDIIVSIDGKKLRIAGCNASGGEGSYSPHIISSDENGSHSYYTRQNAVNWCLSKGEGRRLPTVIEYNDMISKFSWGVLQTSDIPYFSVQTKEPYNMFPAGFWRNIIYNQKTEGLYRTSTQKNSSDSYILYFTMNRIRTIYAYSKTTDAFSVRCVKNF